MVKATKVLSGNRIGARISSLQRNLHISPWEIKLQPPHSISCGVFAYAQLRSLARITARIRLPRFTRKTIYALIDTGADRSCISEKFYNQIRRDKPYPDLSQSPIQLNNANGSELQVKGVTRIPLPITAGISTTTDLFVCSSLAYDVIVGLDILLSTRAIIDLHNQSVTFRSPGPSLPPETEYFISLPNPPSFLRLSKDVTMNSREQRFIDVMFSTPNVPQASQQYIVEPLPFLASQYSLMLPKGIVPTVPQDSKGFQHHRIFITNPTNAPIQLSRSTRLASVSAIFSENMNAVGILSISDNVQSFEASQQTYDSNHPPPDLKLSQDFARDSNPDFSSLINSNLASYQQKELLSLLQHNKDVFTSSPDAPLPMLHVPPAQIETGVTRPQRVSDHRRHPLANRFITTRVQHMLDHGLIEHSVSAWSFPVVLALKPNGKIRFCIDYRRLNAIPVQDAYKLPRRDEILDSMYGKAYFSTLDAASGFHQIPLDQDSKAKTAFSTRWGHFQWTRLPFGYINAPPHFQRTMD